MAFRRFTSLIHGIHKSSKHFHHHHQQHLRFTSSPFTSNPFKSKFHPFKTPYSNRLNPLFCQWFNMIYNHLHRQHHSSFFNLYKNNKTHHKLLHNLLSKRFASMDVSKDYYKILGIKQTATKKEIRSSYLKLAKIWHPDLHKDETEKKKARNKFM